MQFLIFINFAAALQGVFLTYLIVHNRPKDAKSIVLGLLTVVLSISILGGIYGISGYHKKWPHFVNVADPLFLLYGPLLYTYIFVLTKNRLPKNIYLHGLPFLAYVIAFVPLYLSSADEKIQFAEYIFLSNKVPVKGLLMQLTRVVYLSFYAVLSLRMVKTYQKQIKNNYSEIESISLHNAKRILYFFLVVLVIAFVTFVIGYLFSYNYNLSNNIIGFFVAILIYSLAYSTWNKKNAEDLSIQVTTQKGKSVIENKDKLKGRSSYVLNDEQFSEFSHRLKQAIERDRVFVENEISLTELSKKLNIQPYQLSELISRVYGESFFDFINRYRIEEFKEKLKEPEYNSYSLLGIAMDCGFNSKSSFNIAFKKFTGLTPSEYRKQQLRSIATYEKQIV